MSEVKQITREEWWEMFECLPPEAYRGLANGGDCFHMSEYNYHTFSSSYAAWRDIYITKEVNVLDRSTWITTSDFDGLKPLDDSDGDS